MRTALVVASVALAVSQASAFKNTSPLLVWSSTPNEALSEASSEVISGVISAEEIYGTISSLGCDWERLVVVHVDELHHSHIASRALPYPTTPDLHIPYLLRPSRSGLDTAVSDWAAMCGADVVGGKKDGKKLIVVDTKEGQDLSSLDLPTQPHLLLLTGTHPQKRQEQPFPSASSSASSSSILTRPTSSQNSTIPTDGPLLQRVQIITTPIITGLLVTFLVFVPLLSFGIWALVGIQVPPRMMEISKGMVVGKERKDQ